MSDYVKARLAEIEAQSKPRPIVRKPVVLKQPDPPRKPEMSTLLDSPVTVNTGLSGNGCGHDFLMSRTHYDECKASGRTWYCTICGTARMFGGKSTIDQLKGDLAAAKQREETEKALKNKAQEELRKERESKARLKKRVKNGVCPCCTRTFTNVARHMQTKHPEFKA